VFQPGLMNNRVALNGVTLVVDDGLWLRSARMLEEA